MSRRQSTVNLARMIRFVRWAQRWDMQHARPPRAREIADVHGVHYNTAAIWRRAWLESRRPEPPHAGVSKVNNHAFQLDPERLKAAGHQILATMTAIQNEQGFPPTEVVAIALYCVGAALAEIGCVIPTDGAINEYLLPLAKGYDHSFAAYSKKYAN